MQRKSFLEFLLGKFSEKEHIKNTYSGDNEMTKHFLSGEVTIPFTDILNYVSEWLEGDDEIISKFTIGEKITDNTNKKSFNASFSTALNWLRRGHKVSRNGWNGKGMFLIYINPNYYDLDWKRLNLDVTERLGFIAMKTADNKIVPWLASQTDVLAEDWEITE